MAKILVIDDESTILQNIKFLLEIDGNEVLTASSSTEGLRIFTENCNSIDVVITDMKMPKLSGMDILREIKKITPHMAVIILTGHGDLDNAILAMKEGAFEYLRKPVTAQDLSIAINNAINRKKLLMENERMTQELLAHRNYLQGLHDSAAKILLNMLPKNLPDIEGFNFAVDYKSCDGVGGDMYDVCDIGDYICFYVFDVSHHGILAAVISIIIKSFLQNIEYNYRQGINKRRFPEIVLDLNLELLSNTAQNVFASLFLGFIDKNSKKLYTVSAGHIPQYIMKENGLVPLESTGPILGVFEDSTYKCAVNQLEPGDKVLLFTDGIIESPSDSSDESSDGNQIFGYENMVKVLESCKNEPISTTIDKIMKAVKDFSGNRCTDDMTILGVEVLKEN
ncbi:MAG TPA: fused response regulator/phosphatase [Hungateiclostridium thermocellum]|jgi:sigma-B regulation protein RsbU (phosphoserine phosphatase)|uniref:Stage 0 sporulation protein A homolog n=2 Tax=Acetivibrio thermocellus TaxID=1515 RepID=A3DCZ0_ACET2|nr:response regulator [Acetivibrio thermocellus]CDG35276.1 response regulator receiver protein [Acetivibrio thermocellus BC1]ABN51819.1 response regulator receiver protein [Acetivibrio thermocellus ATCC 27405]ADU74711.1 response regulator receiver protein [Acetivibrio thermocellus DSM 1313]ALX08662.1 response regulator receiver protein [Acetivibrio thermocellus AD2]ANV76414.1 response regulator receiver protein [Acetivibrio thermocellus DSM 2360]